MRLLSSCFITCRLSSRVGEASSWPPLFSCLGCASLVVVARALTDLDSVPSGRGRWRVADACAATPNLCLPVGAASGACACTDRQDPVPASLDLSGGAPSCPTRWAIFSRSVSGARLAASDHPAPVRRRASTTTSASKARVREGRVPVPVPVTRSLLSSSGALHDSTSANLLREPDRARGATN